MALSLRKVISVTKSCLFVRCLTSIGRKTVLRSIDHKSLLDRNYFQRVIGSDVHHKMCQNVSLQHFSISSQPELICWEGSCHAVLLRKLEIALKDHQVDEAWETFKDIKRLYGFPSHSLVSRLITELSYSSNPHWLQKACDLVYLILKEKSDLLHSDSLTKLSLSLSRAQMPIPASMILRLMLEKGSVPQKNVLWLIILHMVKTEIGTYLASNYLVQICDHFLLLSASKSNHAKLIKPDTMIFNLVLDACVRFGSSFKGQQIIELMPQVGVGADAHSIIIIAQIHEMNGQRDDLKKFKCHIDQVSIQLACHYRQFYDSLLSLHFKFNDIDGAAGLVLDMCRCWDSLSIQKDRNDPHKTCLVPIGSYYLKEGLKLQIVPELLQKDSVFQMDSKQELLLFRNGKYVLSNKALAKLIIAYKRDGRIGELSRLMLSLQKELGTLEGGLISDVIDACIQLGWLETAHDILDDMELAGAPASSITYMSLLTAYYKGKMVREAKALLKQMRKAGLIVDLSDEMVMTTCLSGVVDKNRMHTRTSTSIWKSGLAESLVREMKKQEKAILPVVYKFNSSIYFFCKAKMIDDALRIYGRMQEMKIEPTVQTFINLVYGYSCLNMYREITILWGDIKSSRKSGSLVVCRDLYEFLVLNFLRGGYFERVMEVIGCMKEQNMYCDKWMYKREFLKFHKDLYRNLKASNTRTEAQSKRLEYVEAFRTWAGID